VIKKSHYWCALRRQTLQGQINKIDAGLSLRYSAVVHACIEWRKEKNISPIHVQADVLILTKNDQYLMDMISIFSDSQTVAIITYLLLLPSYENIVITRSRYWCALRRQTFQGQINKIPYSTTVRIRIKMTLNLNVFDCNFDRTRPDRIRREVRPGPSGSDSRQFIVTRCLLLCDKFHSSKTASIRISILLW
jgi:hypothetical protein